MAAMCVHASVRCSKDLYGHGLRDIVHEKVHPAIPEFVLPGAAQLIHDCLKHNSAKRPSFASIRIRLEVMKFGIAVGVRPEKIFRFVRAVEARAKLLGIELE
jgi:hypothetical protein